MIMHSVNIARNTRTIDNVMGTGYVGNEPNSNVENVERVSEISQ